MKGHTTLTNKLNSLLLIASLLIFSFPSCNSSKQKTDESKTEDLSESADPVIRQAFSREAEAGGTVGHAGDPHQLTRTELSYGRAPQPAPGLQYQDGVILMEHGDQAIQAAGSDGLSWVLDANAPHADEIQVDKVLFATDRCMGRVLSVERVGDKLGVILGPVQITDVIKQGHFVYNHPLDLNSLVGVVAPDYPGAPESDAAQQMKAAGKTALRHTQPSITYAVVTPSGEWKPMPMIEMPGAPRVMPASWQPPSAQHLLAVAQGDYFPSWPKFTPGPLPVVGGIPPVQLSSLNISPCFFSCGGIGIHLYQEKDGVKVDLKAVLHMSAPSLTFNIDVSPGYVKTAAISLSGAAGFTITFEAAAAKDMSANIDTFGQIPMNIELPIVGLGVPLKVILTTTIKLQTAFSAKTSVLKGQGDFTASGGLTMGYINGKWGASGMKMTLKQNLADAVGGVSVGISSLVFGVNETVMVGLGAFGFATGPYVALVSSITATDQSSIAMRPCRQGTFNMDVYAGIGYSIPKLVASIVNFFLSLVHVKPIPAQGDAVRMTKPYPLVEHKDQIPTGCAGK
jgi:hypothetical protein